MISLGLQTLADSSSGLGALGVSWSAFVIQLITFILAYLVLRKWAFGPILKILKERRDKIAQGVSLGEAMEKEKIELEERVAKEIAEARVRADTILADANESAKEAVRKAEVDAEAKAEGIISEAKAQTKQDMQRAKRQLEGEIVNLVSEATEVITGEKVDKTKDAKLIDRAIAGVEQ
ncbi:MAG TPA: F0F1 ATP synthase subunit B [Candidatus Saccharimonadales bacterium]